jgi:hypothetical protein
VQRIRPCKESGAINSAGTQDYQVLGQIHKDSMPVNRTHGMARIFVIFED